MNCPDQFPELVEPDGESYLEKRKARKRARRRKKLARTLRYAAGVPWIGIGSGLSTIYAAGFSFDVVVNCIAATLAAFGGAMIGYLLFNLPSMNAFQMFAAAVLVASDHDYPVDKSDVPYGMLLCAVISPALVANGSAIDSVLSVTGGAAAFALYWWWHRDSFASE